MLSSYNRSDSNFISSIIIVLYIAKYIFFLVYDTVQVYMFELVTVLLQFGTIT